MYVDNFSNAISLSDWFTAENVGREKMRVCLLFKLSCELCDRGEITLLRCPQIPLRYHLDAPNELILALTEGLKAVPREQCLSPSPLPPSVSFSSSVSPRS